MANQKKISFQDIQWNNYLGSKEKPFPKATDADISNLEVQLGCALPYDFKQIVKDHQGMSTSPGAVQLPSGSLVSLGCLFHVFIDGPQNSYSILANALNLKEDGFINYIPISQAGNCYFCFDYNQPADPLSPPIFFIAGDYEKEDPRSTIFVAHNIIELLSTLTDG